MNDILIEGSQNKEIDTLIEGIENDEPVVIEGFFSFIKKAVSKVSKVGKIANQFGLLPPGTGFGLNMLNKLASSPKTKNKVKFSPEATKNVYQVAFLKGYQKGLSQIEEYAKSKRS
jgi:hypothetical protein